MHIIACPQCKQKLQVEPDSLGIQVQCPFCTGLFTATDPKAVTTAPAPSRPPIGPPPPPSGPPESPPPVSAPEPAPERRSRPSESKASFSSVIQSWGQLALLGLIVLFLFIIMISGPGRPSWEYKLEFFHDTDFVAKINQRGLEGWELSHARRAEDGGRFGYEIVFKRQR